MLCNRLTAHRVISANTARTITMQKYYLFLEACLAATCITGLMDATGYLMFSALPLIVLIPFYAYRAGFNAGTLGYKLGNIRWYAPALGLPLLVIGIIVFAAFLNGDAQPSKSLSWLAKNLALQFTVGVLVVAITEEGFFRGLIYALLSKAGLHTSGVIWLSTIVFVAWHLPAVLMDTEFAPALSQLPVYLLNALMLGIIWGALRELSGSVWVASVHHALWNPLAYLMFGFGEKSGVLAIDASWLYGPEVGLAGLFLNTLVAVWLVQKVRKQLSHPETQEPTGIS